MINEDDDVCGASINTAAAAAAPPTARRLFILQSVNSYGSTETNRLVDDGTPLDFDGKYTYFTTKITGVFSKMTTGLFSLLL